MDEMTDWEIRDILPNIQYTDLNHWDMTRMLYYSIFRVNSSKKHKFTPKDLLTLPWDKESKNREVKSEEREYLMNYIENFKKNIKPPISTQKDKFFSLTNRE